MNVTVSSPYADLDTLGKRVKYFREEKGWTQAQLASQILINDEGKLKPIDASVIGNIESRNSKSSRYVGKLAVLLGVNLNWLTTGEGKPFDEVAPQITHTVIGGNSIYPPVLIDWFSELASQTESKQRLPVGFTVEFLSENQLPVDAKGLILMINADSGMGYTIPLGTPLLVNTNELHFGDMKHQQVYVFMTNDERLVCKRISKHLDGTITLISDSLDKINYPNQLLTKDSFNCITVIGRVCYAFTKF